MGLDVTVDDDLIETDFGAWEGLTFGEAAERDPELHRTWLRDTSISPPDGESFDSVLDRVQRVRNRVTAEHAGETVLVVSHVTPIKTLLRLALDAGPGILYRAAPGSGVAVHRRVLPRRWRRRCGWSTRRHTCSQLVQVEPFAVYSEDHDGLCRSVRGAEPVRCPGAEFDGFAGLDDEVALAEDESNSAGQHVHPVLALVNG